MPRRKSIRAPATYNGHWSDHMKISTVRDFRDNATGLLRSKDPTLVTRRGRLAGIFFPWPEGTMRMVGRLRSNAFLDGRAYAPERSIDDHPIHRVDRVRIDFDRSRRPRDTEVAPIVEDDVKRLD